MAFFIPVALAGGLGTLGVSHAQASRNIERINLEHYEPLFGFWWGVGVGCFLGLWIGVSFSRPLTRLLKWFDFFSDETQKND